VIRTRRYDERGEILALVIAIIALGVGVMALVVAITRDPSSTTTTPTSVQAGAGSVRVPDVVGTATKDARRKLKTAGLTASVHRTSSATVAKGQVVSESPAAGTSVAKGATVTLDVSKGP
jgi:beta-lactam-binding protein with PASTA domain